MLHTWAIDFARDLLKESGYKTSIQLRGLLPIGFVIEPSSYNNQRVVIPIENGRVLSEPLREYLNTPLVIGGMRVRVQQKSLVDFGD